jgi:hypothetical protein
VSQIEKAYDHPAMLPVDLCEQLVATFSRKGANCLDPFAGVGSVGVACQRQQRNFTGIEIVERYARTATLRLQSAESLKPLRLNVHIREPRRLDLFMRRELKLRPSYRKIIKLIISRTIDRKDAEPVRHLEIAEGDIAAGVQKSRRSIIRSLDSMAERGYITKVDRIGKCSVIGVGDCFLDL